MGLLDNLKIKAREGLTFASEKLGVAADYLASNIDNNDKNEISTNDFIEPENQVSVPCIDEDNSATMQQTVPIVQNRMIFSVNENDTNETRQIKEIAQDTNEVVLNVNQIVNGETMRNFSEAAKVIAVSYSMYKSREQEIERELEIIDKQNQFNLDAMKLAYQNINPRIDSLIEEVKSLLVQLKTYEGKELTESEQTKYNGLITLITNLSGQTMRLYEKIMS